MTDLIIIAVLAVIILIAVWSMMKRFNGGGSCCSSSTYKAKPKKLETVTIQKIFTVDGMTCQHCVNRVMDAVNSIDNVSGNVNLKKGTVTVSMACPVDDAVIKSAIEKHGYTVTNIQ